jgi:antitoxin component of RelBE/YafQ-DinJ toxin-antitoxin module
MTEKIINFRVDENLKKGFEMVAKNLDLTSSQMLRAYMREAVENYLKNNAQQSLLAKEPTRPKKETKSKQKSVIPDSWRHK